MWWHERFNGRKVEYFVAIYISYDLLKASNSLFLHHQSYIFC
jgi:hypothetical protein